MSSPRKLTCEGCHGVVRSPRRGVTLEQSMSNHQKSCPTTSKKEVKP
jgi:hypothetical protein